MLNIIYKKSPALILGLVLCLITGAAQAQNADQNTARDTALTGARAVLALVQEPLFINPDTRSQAMPEIERTIGEFMDFEEFSMRMVGAMWRQFTPEQKARFQAAFTTLMEHTYIDAVVASGADDVTFVDEISSDNNTRYEIRLNFSGDTSNILALRLMLKDGRWVVYDIIVEGISLVGNYREQFRSLTVSGNPEDLISRVEERAATLR